MELKHMGRWNGWGLLEMGAENRHNLREVKIPKDALKKLIDGGEG